MRQRNKKFIINAARFTEQKDLFTLVKAYAFVKEQIDISLILLGDGPQKSEIKELTKQLNLTEDVHLLGFVEHPQYYIKDASAFVLSSKWEGFGNVLVEAMGVGTPIISTNCPSGPAEILEHGKYGRLVPIEAPKRMAGAIIETLEDPIESEILIERARDFSVPKVANEYLKYINL